MCEKRKTGLIALLRLLALCGKNENMSSDSVSLTLKKA